MTSVRNSETAIWLPRVPLSSQPDGLAGALLKAEIMGGWTHGTKDLTPLSRPVVGVKREERGVGPALPDALASGFSGYEAGSWLGSKAGV